jgi:hypothetical protein
MEVNTIALLLAFGIIGVLLTLTLILSSHKNKQAWQPTGPEEKNKISPIALVEEAHNWYASSKQDKDLTDALVHSSYGIACLRAIQNVVQLEEVTSVALPANVHGAVGLMAKLTTQQQLIMTKIRSLRKQALRKIPTLVPIPAPQQIVNSAMAADLRSGPPIYIPKDSRRTH